MKKVAPIRAFKALQSAGSTRPPVDHRVANALEYIAEALGAQAEVMIEQHNAAVDRQVMENIKKIGK